MIPFIETMSKAYDITGKNVIITGGRGGIGFGIAKAMAASGANVAILDRNMDGIEEILSELRAYGGKHQAYACDILEPESVRLAVEAVCEAFGSIDGLVNNAGIALNRRLLDMDRDLAIWRRVVDTNLTGMAQVTYEAGLRMRDAGKGGSIINITSNTSFVVYKECHISPYSAAKAGGNDFTRSMAVELGEYNIRVNAIAPGLTAAGIDGPQPNPFTTRRASEAQVNKRKGEAIEIGALAVFLASPAAAHITGEIIKVDGGHTLAF